ncbi:MAG: alkaline phosphatase [Planctomycetales bacterium]
MSRRPCLPALLCVLLTSPLAACGQATIAPRSATPVDDHIRGLQTAAIHEGRSPAAHWGTDPAIYTHWGSHSNRLVPVYTFGTKGAGAGVDLDGYSGANSPYRREGEVRRMYGYLPENTVDPAADYCDQTNIADIQRRALESGKKHIVLIVFDGMDWQTTWAAAIHKTGRIPYREGRGTGLHFQDYDAAGTSQFGWMVASPLDANTVVDENTQTIRRRNRGTVGGYDASRGGSTPWAAESADPYLIEKGGGVVHTIPDSAPTATALAAGVKTFNGAIGVDAVGNKLVTVAHRAQQAGRSVGLVSSVPVSHATPAAMYAHNVSRDDFQDISRDLLGRPSIAHPENPLPGVDVLIGGGWGCDKSSDRPQGENFLPGNRYLADADLRAVDVRNGGAYLIATREKGVRGADRLKSVAERAARDGTRLLGLYGVGRYNGHLPYRTADGDYQPAPGRNGTAERYDPADVAENPTLAEMTDAALVVLSRNPNGFWLMVEAGDVDWANHDNNLDNAIGAVESGDEAVRAVTAWVEKHSNWSESLLIVTADHGHLLVLDQPERLVPEGERPKRR